MLAPCHSSVIGPLMEQKPALSAADIVPLSVQSSNWQSASLLCCFTSQDKTEESSPRASNTPATPPAAVFAFTPPEVQLGRDVTLFLVLESA